MRAPLTISGWMRYDIVRDHIERLNPASILELGVGLGGISSLIADGRRYVGVEPDEESRRIAQERLPGHTIVASLEQVDREAEFDLVCAFEVIEHIEDHHGMVAEWSRRVARGGHLMLSAPADSTRFDAWDRAAGHHRRYDESDILQLASAAQLESPEIRHFGYPLGTLLERLRNFVAKRSDRVERPMDEVTADSARQLQPSWWAGGATKLVGRTAARLQRPFQVGGRGTGVVMLARRAE